MLKRLISVCLLVTLISSGFSRFFIYAGFELNHKYIAEELCVNKARPWLHCNGRCYFMRKIKEAGESDKKQERAAQQNHYQEALPALTPVSLTALNDETQQIAYPKTAAPGIIERVYSILIPPKIA
jgi:hypothetical protein|eukprot:gene16388-16566_t